MSQAYTLERQGGFLNTSCMSAAEEYPEKYTRRREWMSVLARADVSFLEARASDLVSGIEYKFLRKPEAGLLMMQARTGNAGRRFNLGEVLVTRAVVSLAIKKSKKVVEGYSMVMGDKPRHAELAAVFDALMQTELGADLEVSLLAPIRAGYRGRNLCTSEKVRRTKVDFYTMVRGED